MKSIKISVTLIPFDPLSISYIRPNHFRNWYVQAVNLSVAYYNYWIIIIDMKLNHICTPGVIMQFWDIHIFNLAAY